MHFKLFVISLLSLMFSVVAATAQSSRSSSQKVTATQLEQLSNLRDAGYTDDQILNLAKDRGADQKQLNMLKRYLKGEKVSDKEKAQAEEEEKEKQAEQQAKEQAGMGQLSQKYATYYTEEDKMVFGFDLFNNKSLSFEPSTNMPVPDTYVLSYGDQVNIEISGQSEMNYELMVENNGDIVIPYVGSVNVAGKTFEVAKSIIRSKLKTIYSDLGSKTIASIRLGQVRTINVSVLGEVHLPGTYTVSGAASLFNVLYLSGGPTYSGSFRNIKLIRNGKVINTLDVYDFMLNGNGDVNVPLQANDIIMVPVFESRILVSGEFNKTGYFEAKEGETVADIIRYAGDYKPTAVKYHTSIIRVGRSEMEFLTVKDPESMLVKNGDELTVSGVGELKTQSKIDIWGAVYSQGSYAYHEGIMLSDLVEMAGGLTPSYFPNRGIITRWKDDLMHLETISFNPQDFVEGKYDVELKNGDMVYFYDAAKSVPRKTVFIGGAVGAGDNTYLYEEGLTLGDLILRNGGLTAEASSSQIEITRRLSYAEGDTSRSVFARSFYIDIDRDLHLDDEGSNFKLEPFDYVFVRKQMAYNNTGQVKIGGEVCYPGYYNILDKNDNIMTIIRRSGGYTQKANLEGVKLFRKEKLSEPERDLRMQQELQAYGDTPTWYINEESQYHLVAVELAGMSDAEISKIHLEDGDQIIVPSYGHIVAVKGNVLNPVSLTFVGRKSAKYYVNMAGGFGPRSKKSSTFVVYANGRAKATKHFLWFKNYPKVEPGSEVVVVEKPEATFNAMGWVSMGSTIVSALAVIAGLLL